MLIKTSRRDMLRGLGLGAGITMFGHVATRWISEARGDSIPANKGRLLIYMNNLGIRNGVRPQRTSPDSELGFDLRGFSPLEPLRDKLLYVDALYHPFELHLHGPWWPLVGKAGTGEWNDSQASSPGDISFDRFLGQQLGPNDPFRSLSFSTGSKRLSRNGGSVDGPGQVYPTTLEPAEAFAQVFSGFAGDAVTIKQQWVRDRRVLDLVHEDVQRLQSRLAGPEVEKLEQYIDSIQGIEDKLVQLEALDCRDPMLPDGGAREAFLDIILQAFACELTHVALLRGNGYSGPDPNEWTGSHKMWHEGSSDEESHLNFHRYHAQKMLETWQKLEALSMDEDTIVLWYNQSGGGHHRGMRDIPALILGNPSGYFSSGRHVQLPVDDDGDATHFVGDLFVSVANALGVDIDCFGDPAHCRGPLPGLV